MSEQFEKSPTLEQFQGTLSGLIQKIDNALKRLDEMEKELNEMSLFQRKTQHYKPEQNT